MFSFILSTSILFLTQLRTFPQNIPNLLTDKFFKYRLVVTYKKRKFNNTLIIECTTFLSP